MGGTKIMKSRLIFLFVLFAITVGLAVSAGADTRYVTDMLVLTVRDRPDDEAGVLGNLRTADSVEVLEESGPYLRIRAQDGLEGWVQKNYITSKRPKAIIIEEMQNEINRLNSKIENFDKKRDAYVDEVKVNKQADKIKIEELEESVSSLNGELKQLTGKYNTLVNESKKNIGTLAGESKKLKAINTEPEYFF